MYIYTQILAEALSLFYLSLEPSMRYRTIIFITLVVELLIDFEHILVLWCQTPFKVKPSRETKSSVLRATSAKLDVKYGSIREQLQKQA